MTAPRLILTLKTWYAIVLSIWLTLNLPAACATVVFESENRSLLATVARLFGSIPAMLIELFRGNALERIIFGWITLPIYLAPFGLISKSDT